MPDFFWVLFEKQSISRKLETHRCPGCLLNLALSMPLRAISGLKPQTVSPTHSSIFTSGSSLLSGSEQNFRAARLSDGELSIRLWLQGISGW